MISIPNSLFIFVDFLCGGKIDTNSVDSGWWMQKVYPLFARLTV